MSASVERRRALRCSGSDEHGIVRVRVRPGHDALLLDISSAGAGIETSHRLLPGTLVELQLETQQARVCARGRVVRCTVAAVLSNRMSYHGAVCFEDSIASVLPPHQTEPPLQLPL